MHFNKILSFAFKLMALGALFLLLTFFYCRRMDLTTLDLGRHIRNGEFTVKQGRPIDTNFYSYTQPDKKCLNHHWGTGIIFYGVWKYFGFYGVSCFYTLLLLSAFCLTFFFATRISNFQFAYFWSVLCLPFLVSRLEVRPEGISYVCLMIFLMLLTLYKKRQMKASVLWLLVPLQIFWVNVHIFFVFGPMLVFLFWMDALSAFDRSPVRAGHQDKKFLGWLFLVTVLACFINPYGMRGALAPLTIFEEYGYMLVENQSVLFMRQRFPDKLLYLHFEILFGFLVILLIVHFAQKRLRQDWVYAGVLVIFSALAWRAVRGIVVFGFMAVPLCAYFFYQVFPHRFMKARKWCGTAIFLASFIFVCFALANRGGYYSPIEKMYLPFILEEKKEDYSIMDIIKNYKKLPGLMPRVNQSVRFFKAAGLKGPIFNNYDIGGYLIFHLFDQERVFVDNRPESYTTEFFKNVYIPMQEKEGVWRQKLNEYHFNVIYFYRHDMTPWAQPFLIRRLQDPAWVPVYVDSYVLILVRRNKKNAEVIRRFELPKNMFRVSVNP